MKKEIALQLADAITSGHYKRARGYNRTSDNRFCIGGVLINLFAQAHPDLAAKERDPLRFMGTNSTIPYDVMVWADVKYIDMASRDGKPLGLKKKPGCWDPVSLQTASDALVHTIGIASADCPFVYSWEEIANWLRKGKNHARI